MIKCGKMFLRSPFACRFLAEKTLLQGVGELAKLSRQRQKGKTSQCKDDRTAGRTKGVRHTCPEPLKGRGEARYFAPKGTQGKGGVGKKSKAEGLSAGDSPGGDRSARPEVRGAQDKGNESRIQ